jgi:hypothetical protein
MNKRIFLSLILIFNIVNSNNSKINKLYQKWNQSYLNKFFNETNFGKGCLFTAGVLAIYIPFIIINTKISNKIRKNDNKLNDKRLTKFNFKKIDENLFKEDFPNHLKTILNAEEKSFIFHGITGSGKTHAAQLFAKEKKLKYQLFSTGDLFVSCWVGHRPKLISDWFNDLIEFIQKNKNENFLVILDEIDTIGKRNDRNTSLTQDTENTQGINTFLSLFERLLKENFFRKIKIIVFFRCFFNIKIFRTVKIINKFI